MITPLQQNSRLTYWLIMGSVGLFSLLLILLYSTVDQNSINQKYATPFRAKAEKAAAFRDSGFNHRGVGMSESNIYKYQGRHYETY